MSENAKESAIQRSILDALMYMGILAWRNNVAPIPIRRGRQIIGIRRADQHTIGMPDILCVIRGHLIGLEVKSAIGKQRPEQKEWQEKLEKAGGTYAVVRSLEDAEKIIKPFIAL